MFSVSFVNEIRRTEFDRLAEHLPAGGRVLEFGAGTGQQALLLAERGYDVVAIDLASSDYSSKRLFPVEDYDGRHIPLPDSSVDAILSSNVLEHVEDLPQILREFRRVLRPGGVGVHAMPTSGWRVWTTLAGLPAAVIALARALFQLPFPPAGRTRRQALGDNLWIARGGLIPHPHGIGRSSLGEIRTFSEDHWRGVFAGNGHQVAATRPVGLFYTGHLVLGRAWPLQSRAAASRLLGSAARIYLIR